jgi:hypothetical protein
MNADKTKTPFDSLSAFICVAAKTIAGSKPTGCASG